MRENRDAVVDSKGVGATVNPEIDPNENAFQILVNVLLSIQTNDLVTDKIMKRLLEEEGGITIQKYSELSADKFKKKIPDINFNKKKSEWIVDVAKSITDDYNGKVPDSFEELTKFKGVGAKVAHLVLQIGFDKVEGICVDTHVHRISNILGWVKTNNPNATMTALEKVFDKEYWRDLNPTIVGFGQSICAARNPKCEECLLNDECSIGKTVMKKVNKKN